MSPARTGLAILVVAILFGSFVLSQDSTLFAQDSSPSPTAVPFDELPVCPPFTPDSAVPTPTVDFLNSDDEPRCRVEAPSSTAEPTPTAPVPTPIAPAANTQNPPLYLPSVQGATSQSNLVDAGEIIDSDEPAPKDIPFDQLPECPEFPPIDQTKLPPPDQDAPRCRVKPAFVTDVSAELKSGKTLSDLGIAGDPPQWDPESAQTSDMAMPDATFTSSWAQHNFAISSSPYATKISGIASLFSASLAAGKSWNDFHYYNRIMLGSNTTGPWGCGQLDKFTLGIIQGTLGSHTSTTPKVIYEEYTSHTCQVGGGTLSVSGSIAMQIRRIGVNTWQGEVWTGGTWAVLFSSTPISWGQDGAIRAAGGHEYWTRNGEKSSMSIPTNFISHLAINNTPWATVVLPGAWSGASNTLAESPFAAYDLVGGSYTSIVIRAN